MTRPSRHRTARPPVAPRVRRGAVPLLAALVVACTQTGPTDPLDTAAAPPAAAVAELDARLAELPPGSPLDFPASAFAPIDAMLAGAEVVGLGEATHGTAEFAELKHRLFRHLVEVHGHRALGYELGFAESLALDRWVAGGAGSLDELLAGLSWIQANREVRALLEWMRAHNRGLRAHDRVRLIGIDSQLDMWHVGLHRSILRERAPALERQLGPELDELQRRGRIDYRTISREAHDELAAVLGRIAGVAREHAGTVDTEDAAIAVHLVEALQRSHEFLYCAYQGTNDVRDRHLAANAEWIRTLVGEGVPYSVWAHDAHVASNPRYYGPEGPGSMGVHLERRLGNRYVRVATAFTRGGLVAVQSDWRGRATTPIPCRIDADPPPDSANALLDRAGPERYLVQLRGLPAGGPLHAFLDRERPLLGVGDFYAGEVGPHYRSPDRVLRLLEAFDVLVYFSDTRGVRPLPADDDGTP